eukprot:149243_1
MHCKDTFTMIRMILLYYSIALRDRNILSENGIRGLREEIMGGSSKHIQSAFILSTPSSSVPPEFYQQVDIAYLPPYCCFLDPVEHIFAALKAAIRRHRRELEEDPIATFAIMMEDLRDFNVLGLLRRIGYNRVCN